MEIRIEEKTMHPLKKGLKGQSSKGYGIELNRFKKNRCRKDNKRLMLNGRGVKAFQPL